MTGNHRIVLEVSPALFGRMQARAAERRYALAEWVLRAAIRALYPPEFTLERVDLEAAWAARPPLSAPRPAMEPPATEGRPHAAHT